MQTELPGDAVLPSPTPRPTVKAVDVADLISYIHHTLGFPPRNSVTAISLAGHSLGAVLRCDWDPGAVVSWPAHCSYARQVASHLASDHRADGCVAVLFRDGPAAAEDPTTDADRMLAVALDREFSALGLCLREAWLVTGGRVWHVDCPQPAACPSHGMPVSRVETSVINASLILEGSLVSEEPTGSGLPAPAEGYSPELLIAVAHVSGLGVAGPRPGEDPEDARSRALVAWLKGWEQVLDGGPLPEEPGDRALLAAGLIRIPWRDCLLAAASFSLERAVSGAAWLGTVPVSTAGRLGTEPREVNAVLFTSVLLAASRRGPDWDRIAQLRTACLELLPESAGRTTTVLRCLAAWIEWIRGHGSAAGRILVECRLDDPEYSLGELLEEMTDRGMLSGWAGRRETAWSATARRG